MHIYVNHASPRFEAAGPTDGFCASCGLDPLVFRRLPLWRRRYSWSQGLGEPDMLGERRPLHRPSVGGMSDASSAGRGHVKMRAVAMIVAAVSQVHMCHMDEKSSSMWPTPWVASCQAAHTTAMLRHLRPALGLMSAGAIVPAAEEMLSRRALKRGGLPVTQVRSW